MTTWYRVARWDDKPFPREVVRRTAKQLIFAGGGRSMVVTNWFQWFPSEGEALASIASRKAREADRKAADLIRDAAPDLLEILPVILALAKLKFGNLDDDVNAQFAKAEAAIAKARGQ